MAKKTKKVSTVTRLLKLEKPFREHRYCNLRHYLVLRDQKLSVVHKAEQPDVIIGELTRKDLAEGLTPRQWAKLAKKLREVFGRKGDGK
jgi:hypothetical protein